MRCSFSSRLFYGRTRAEFDVYQFAGERICVSSVSHKLTMLQIALLIAICISTGVRAASLETVHDEELLNLIKTEKYVVVLFSKFVSLFFLSPSNVPLEK